MKSVFHSLSKSIDRFIDRTGNAVSWLTAVLMILICVDVVMRYLFSSTKTWVIELEWHLFAIIFLIGASFGLLHDKHVRVDVFFERFSSKNQRNSSPSIDQQVTKKAAIIGPRAKPDNPNQANPPKVEIKIR